MTHTFDVDEKVLICEEELYYSDKTTATGYPLEHHHNRGKLLVPSRNLGLLSTTDG